MSSLKLTFRAAPSLAWGWASVSERTPRAPSTTAAVRMTFLSCKSPVLRKVILTAAVVLGALGVRSLTLAQPQARDGAARKVSFNEDIQPIFQQNCYQC